MRIQTNQQLLAELFCEGQSLGSVVIPANDRMIIGRSQKADLVVPQGGISQIHAMLRLRDNTIELLDLGSESGTYVSGKKIIEHKLQNGERFQLGQHQVRVSILENSTQAEQMVFWKKTSTHQNTLELLRIRNGIVQENLSLQGRESLRFGFGKKQLSLPEQGTFLARQTDGYKALLPKKFQAFIYNRDNVLLRSIEQEGSSFHFSFTEKVQLKSPEEEILLYWQAQTEQAPKSGADRDSSILKKSMALSVGLSLIFTLISLLRFSKEELPTESAIPKSSYYRLSVESAPAGSEASSASNISESAASAPINQEKIASLQANLSKLLQKSSAVSAENIKQAIAANGKQSTRVGALGSSSGQTQNIAGSGLGGGINVGAMSSGLSNGSGKGASSGTKGFGAPGVVGGSGFGGKGFDMALGGDEEEAVGGLDKSLIAAVVQANIGQIKHCYEKQLLVDPNLFGKVVAAWTIDKEGKVSLSSVKKSTMNSRNVENCIVAKIKNWNFPKPKGGGQVLVSYPFLFKSLN